MKKVQLVWWWRSLRFKKWKYPRDYANPLFVGYDLGILEIRVWNKPPYK